jgi:hypothetical protein
MPGPKRIDRRECPTPRDRPTIPPGFDVARFARDSDEKVARAEPVTPPPPSGDREEDAPVTQRSETRLATRPGMGATTTDEAWARTVAGAPFCTMTHETLKRLPLDHRAGFLISLMDGAVDLEVLVEISSMKREEVLRTVRDLHESGVVDFR